MSIYRKANKTRESVPAYYCHAKIASEMDNNKVLCMPGNNCLVNIRSFNGIAISPGFERIQSVSS
jgi:hypothetical protein